MCLSPAPMLCACVRAGCGVMRVLVCARWLCCGRLVGVGVRVLVRVHAPRARTCAQACVRSEVACACFGCVHACKCALSTKLVQGSGFSTNTGGTGNIIRIGMKYFCDPIPLHCTVNQIACKTRPALEGRFFVFVYLKSKPKTSLNWKFGAWFSSSTRSCARKNCNLVVSVRDR